MTIECRPTVREISDRFIKNRAMNPMHRGVPPLLPVDHVLFDSLKNVFRFLICVDGRIGLPLWLRRSTNHASNVHAEIGSLGGNARDTVELDKHLGCAGEC